MVRTDEKQALFFFWGGKENNCFQFLVGIKVHAHGPSIWTAELGESRV